MKRTGGVIAVVDLSQSDWEYVAERAGAFVGREWVFERVRSFLSGSPGTFLLRGDPGTGKTAVAARLAQASCGRAQAGGSRAEPPIGEGTISAGVFCRAGKKTVPELIQQLASQLADSVDGFAGVLQSALAPEINVRDVSVTTGDVEAGATVTGVRIVLPSDDDERAFNAGLAAPLSRLREMGRTQPIVLLADAVDEAVSAGKVNTFSRLLGKLDGVHLIVTCRPDPRVLFDFKHAEDQLDLVANVPPDDHDVRDYIRGRLSGRAPEAAVSTLVDRIAAEARGNFLYAFYVTGTVAGSESLSGLDEKQARRFPLPVGGLPGVYEGFLDRQIAGDETRWAQELRPILAPLCAAQGDGFTTGQLGQIASRLSMQAFPQSRARDIARVAAQFLDGPSPDGPFRVYHQSFARFLTDPQQNPNWPIDLTETNGAIVDSLIAAVPVGQDGGKNWAGADSYAKRYLATHAAVSGRLDDFLTDAGYLLEADPNRLLAVLPEASTVAGRNAAGVLRRAAYHFQTCSRATAASYLEVQARQSGLPALADQVARLGLPRPWATPWVQWPRPRQRLRLAPDEDITAMTTGLFHGERVAVLATRRGQVQIRRVTDGTNALEPFTAHDPGRPVTLITALATGEINDQPVILSGDDAGLVNAWNPLAEPPARIFQSHHQGTISALALAKIGDVDVVLSISPSAARLWKWADRTMISSFDLGYRKDVVIGDYDRAPLLGYTDLNYVEFRVFPRRAPVVGMESEWVMLWHYDLVLAGGPRHRDDVTALALLQDAGQTTVVSGDNEGYVWAWDIRDTRDSSEFKPIGRHEHPLKGEGGSSVSAVATAEVNGRKIAASGDYQGQMKIWDLDQYKLIDELPTAHTNDITCLAVTDLDGSPVVVSSARDSVRVWDIDESGSADQPSITALKFASLHGTEVLLAGDVHGTIQVLNVADGLPAAPAFHGHSSEVTAIAIGRTGDEIVALSGGVDGTVQVWNPADATTVGDPFTDHEHAVTAVAVRQLGGRLMAASGGYDRMVRIWDVASRVPLAEPISVGGTVPLGGAAFAELDQRPVIVTAADSRAPSIAQVRDMSDQAPVGSDITLDGAFGAVTTIQSGPQLFIIFSDYNGVVRLRGAPDTSHDVDLHCSQPVWCRGLAATMLDGHPVIMAGSHQNGVIDMWNVGNGRHQRIDIGSAILALAAGPGPTLAVGSEDGIILFRLLDTLRN